MNSAKGHICKKAGIAASSTLRPFVITMSLALLPANLAFADTNPAITAFNTWCFKAGQTEAQARANMKADSTPFSLTFWDDSLEPRPADAPRGVERRCEVAFKGDHSASAISEVRAHMAKPPIFGSEISLPDTHQSTATTMLIEGRELLRGRVAVVHVGTRLASSGVTTFMTVDRLYDGLGHAAK